MFWTIFLIIVAILFIFFGGWTACFFVLRNNPKFIHPESMTKEKLQKLLDRLGEVKI